MKRFLLTTAMCLASTVALAQSKPSSASFTMVPNPQFAKCLSDGTVNVSVKITRGDLNDTGTLEFTGLKPKLAFDLFTVQRSNLNSNGTPVSGFKGFGLAWYQSDVEADDHGSALVVIRTILLDQIFGFDADATAATPPGTVLKPTNTFHMGMWFNDPKDAVPCGFDASKPTPFNGDHTAGPLAMITLPVQPANLGPLCTSPSTSVSSVDDSGSDAAEKVFACNP